MQEHSKNKVKVQENKKTQDQLLERTVDWRKRVTFHHVRGRAVEALGVNIMLFSAVQCHKEFTAEREVEESTPDSDR